MKTASDFSAIAAERRSKSAIRICNHLLDAYESGELDFEKVSRLADGVLSKFDFSTVTLTFTHQLKNGSDRTTTVTVDDVHLAHEIMLGNVIAAALRIVPRKRKRGNSGLPTFVRLISIKLVKLNKGGLHSISRVGRKASRGTIPTAFEWVAEFWKNAGISGVTPAAVEKWHSTKIKQKRRVTQ